MFLFDIIIAPIILGWVFLKYPDIFDAVIPWAAFAWLWHLTWEFVLETDFTKKLVSSAKHRWGTMWWTWLIVFSIGGVISSGYWYLTKAGLAELAVEHNKAPGLSTPPISASQVPQSNLILALPKQEDKTAPPRPTTGHKPSQAVPVQK